MYESFYLEKLKTELLVHAGLSTVTPADCKWLSSEINRRVHRYVSETTLKRFFGFANVKHKFSTFTITALCEFAGKKDWEQFCQAFGNDRVPEAGNSWAVFKEGANKITDLSLRTIRNRSGIPYDQTIGRKFAETDLDLFLSGDQVVTSVVAPSGYGKSILLSRLVGKFFGGENALYRHDAVWFISATHLQEISQSAVSIESWISQESGFSSKLSFAEYFTQQSSQREGRTLIILDGFDDRLINSEQMNRLFAKLANFICNWGDTGWIKVIMSLRPKDWSNFYTHIENSAYLQSRWYPGMHYKDSETANVPLFGFDEIAAILNNIDGKFGEIGSIDPRLRVELQFPFYLQLYYHLSQEKDFDHEGSLTFYELVSDFVRRKISNSERGPEKIYLINKIIRLMDHGKKESQMHKESLLLDISNFHGAYNELIADGILVEERRSPDLYHQGTIRFAHPPIFEYFLSLETLERFEGKPSNELFAYIIAAYEHSPARIQLLQWIVRFMVLSEETESLIFLIRARLPYQEKSVLVNFIARNLRHKLRHSPALAQRLSKSGIHQAFLTEVTCFNFIDPFYYETIQFLASQAGDENNRYLYHAMLGLIAVMKFDKEEMGNQARILGTIRPSFHLLFDPAATIEHVLSRLSGASVTDTGDIAAFLMQYRDRPIHNDPAPEEVLSYVALIQMNAFAGDFIQLGKILSAIQDLHPGILLKRDSGFSTFLLTLLGIFYVRTHKQTAQRIERIVSRNHMNDKELNKHVCGTLLILRAMLRSDDKEAFFVYAGKALRLFKETGLVANQYFVYMQMKEYCFRDGDVTGLSEIEAALASLAAENGLKLSTIDCGVFSSPWLSRAESVYY